MPSRPPPSAWAAVAATLARAWARPFGVTHVHNPRFASSLLPLCSEPFRTFGGRPGRGAAREHCRRRPPPLHYLLVSLVFEEEGVMALPRSRVCTVVCWASLVESRVERPPALKSRPLGRAPAPSCRLAAPGRRARPRRQLLRFLCVGLRLQPSAHGSPEGRAPRPAAAPQLFLRALPRCAARRLLL
ncbi:MAG: hypothetical protein J3K34DRAFT_431459 [Monoraphidium minutum]|nr:MAG: hypothetical protein J3K34DRAFT_431459 [Monoraphidium minutum]